jgi:hypothetical protein
MLGAGIEPAWDLIPRDFKSLASTGFATRAEKDEPAPLAQAASARLRADAAYGQMPLASRAALTQKRN